MAEQTHSANRGASPKKKESYKRFDLSQRIEHGLFLIVFTILALTGLAQKYATAPAGELIIGLLGGIEATRRIHRFLAFILMIESLYHILAVLYRVTVLRVSPSMLPTLDDFRHLFQDIRFYLGRREEKAKYGRYTYAEKVEYFAVVWGMIIMGITGFMMWNPIATTQVVPGEFIPAAKAAHGGEALLAVLAIVIWHFYHVHLRHFNKSMFTGELTREEMEEEHPVELERIESGEVPPPPTEQAVRRRERIFLPLAGVLTLVFGVAIYGFITFEETAIITVERGETAPVFAPQTPTPGPTLPPTPTPAEIQAASWNGGFGALLDARCGNCHGFTAIGGLSLSTYEEALRGGDGGPAIVPGDPEASLLIQIQQAGTHPGQLTDEELAMIREWIVAGAPKQ